MITEEMLRKAAVISSDAFVRSLEANDGDEHIFSPRFEKKIRKLYRRANHPYLYRIMRRVASILLALLIGGGVWLTVDKEARAAFFGWIKEVYEYAVWYSSGDNRGKSAERKDYYIPVLPEGYEEVFVKEKTDARVEIYRNATGQYLQFRYVRGNAFSGLLGGGGEVEVQTVAVVRGQPANIVLSNNPDIANTIIWNTNNAVLAISGFLSPEELIILAECVEEIP